MQRRWPINALLLLGALLAAASCRSAEAQSAPTPPASWSDPRVIAELAKNCAFDPDAIPYEQRKQWTGELYPGKRSPLSCALSFDQSCVYDPCYDEETRECRPRCAKSCHDCGTACAATCETCKRACSDDNCRIACAKSCASCREGCVRTRDRCATGTCTEQFKQCRQKLKDDWLRKGCANVCRAYLRCQKPCISKHDKAGDAYEACTKPCEPKDNKGCNFQFCGGNFGMGINPTEWP